MKTALALVFSLCALLCAGCFSVPSEGDSGPGIVQRTLDATLPPNFKGSADVGHKNAWIDVEIKAEGLRRDPSGWTWHSLKYRRNGRFSHGWITLEPETVDTAK